MESDSIVLTEDNSGFIKKLFIRHTLPGVTAQVTAVIGPVVCGLIAGFAFDSSGLAVVGLFSPFFFLAGFFGTIIASGSTTIAAKYIGKDDSTRVSEIYTLALIMTVGFAVLMGLIMYLLQAPILTQLTRGSELYDLAADYYLPNIFYTVLTVIIFLPISWARLIGKPKIPLIMTIVLTCASVLFALFYTFVLGMGLHGLALAQAYATALSLLVAFALFYKARNAARPNEKTDVHPNGAGAAGDRHSNVCLPLKKPLHIKSDTIAILTAGSPPGLSRLYRFLNIFIINAILMHAVGASAVAIFSMLNLLLRFITALSNGISGVGMPIAGVLNQERDLISLRQLAKALFSYGNILIIPVAILLLVLRQYVSGLFGITYPAAFFALICFSLYIPLYMNGSLFISWYTSVRRTGLANIITFAQDMLLMPLFALILTGSGDNIWLHLPLAGVVTMLLLLILICVTGMLPKIEHSKAALSFSVHCDAIEASKASAAVSDFFEENSFDKRKTMILSMAIEELIMLFAKYGMQEHRDDISIRIMFFDGGTVMRLRTGGKKFDPIEFYRECTENSDDIDDEMLDLMGLKYIVKTAEVIYYRETFGVNNLVIII